MAEKEVLLIEQQDRLESMGSAPMVADSPGNRKGPTSCARCNRKLTNPHSIARTLGPVCYRKSGGGMYDSDMQASEAEWERRAEDLRKGGEWDCGTWDWVVRPKEPGDLPFVVRRTLRVSVRFKGGQFEAYGHVGYAFVPEEEREVLFYRGDDIRACWAAAIAAGPECNAAAYRTEQQLTRAWKAQARGRKPR
ncbi:MAG: DUF6011 domain-containing protein [Bacillota bacterium]